MHGLLRGAFSRPRPSSSGVLFRLLVGAPSIFKALDVGPGRTGKGEGWLPSDAPWPHKRVGGYYWLSCCAGLDAQASGPSERPRSRRPRRIPSWIEGAFAFFMSFCIVALMAVYRRCLSHQPAVTVMASRSSANISPFGKHRLRVSGLLDGPCTFRMSDTVLRACVLHPCFLLRCFPTQTR